MGGSSDPVFSNSRYQFQPQDNANLSSAVSGLQQGVGQANQALGQAAGQVQTNFGQYNPNLITTFAPSQNLDATSRNVVSAGLEQLRNQEGARNRQIAASFQNPGMSRTLQFQNSFRTGAAGNALPFLAQQQQQDREAQAFSLTNNARLANSQMGANLQQLGNAAVGQRADLQQAPMANLQNLLASLAGVAALRGTRISEPNGAGGSGKPNFEQSVKQGIKPGSLGPGMEYALPRVLGNDYKNQWWYKAANPGSFLESLWPF
jgi:hypothetical protein